MALGFHLPAKGCAMLKQLMTVVRFNEIKNFLDSEESKGMGDRAIGKKFDVSTFVISYVRNSQDFDSYKEKTEDTSKRSKKNIAQANKFIMKMSESDWKSIIDGLKGKFTIHEVAKKNRVPLTVVRLIVRRKTLSAFKEYQFQLIKRSESMMKERSAKMDMRAVAYKDGVSFIDKLARLEADVVSLKKEVASLNERILKTL